MSGILTLQNCQRVRRLDLRLLRRVVRFLLEDLLAAPDYEIGVSIVRSPAMARANQDFLGHEGPTDVITFPYSAPEAACLQGDILVCLDVAAQQARAFRTTWQEELVRYIVHAILHLRGYDDLAPAPRRKMKAAENRLVRKLGQEFRLNDLERARR